MRHDNREKKQQYAASAKADITYGRNWPKQLLFVLCVCGVFFSLSEIMQLEIFNRQHESRPFVISNGLIVLLAEIKNWGTCIIYLNF